MATAGFEHTDWTDDTNHTDDPRALFVAQMRTSRLREHPGGLERVEVGWRLALCPSGPSVESVPSFPSVPTAPLSGQGSERGASAVAGRSLESIRRIKRVHQP